MVRIVPGSTKDTGRMRYPWKRIVNFLRLSITVKEIYTSKNNCIVTKIIEMIDPACDIVDRNRQFYRQHFEDKFSYRK